jgi:hypothetical protein
MGDWQATVYQYKLAVVSPETEDSDGSDEEISHSGYDDEDDSLTAVFEGTLLFLSVTVGKGENPWYHHTSKSNALQRSPSVFTPQFFWLI